SPISWRRPAISYRKHQLFRILPSAPVETCRYKLAPSANMHACWPRGSFAVRTCAGLRRPTVLAMLALRRTHVWKPDIDGQLRMRQDGRSEKCLTFQHIIGQRRTATAYLAQTPFPPRRTRI